LDDNLIKQTVMIYLLILILILVSVIMGKDFHIDTVFIPTFAKGVVTDSFLVTRFDTFNLAKPVRVIDTVGSFGGSKIIRRERTVIYHDTLTRFDTTFFNN